MSIPDYVERLGRQRDTARNSQHTTADTKYAAVQRLSLFEFFTSAVMYKSTTMLNMKTTITVMTGILMSKKF